MVCGSCVKKIESHFKHKREIQQISVSLTQERVEIITSKKIKDELIKEDLHKLNFEAETISCE